MCAQKQKLREIRLVPKFSESSCFVIYSRRRRLPWWHSGKDPPANAGDGRVVGRSPGGGNGNPLQYSCLENLMDRGDWQATVHGVTKESDTTECIYTHTLSLSLSQAYNGEL